MHKLGITLGLLLNTLTSFAGPLELYFQEKLEKQTPHPVLKSIRQAYFTQLIDHNNPARGTFQQRYYMDESFSKSNDDPVFFYICGEAACTERSLQGAIRTYAEKFHAKLVALEHRYYGESIPVNSFSTDNLRDLTVDAALDDLAYFQRRLRNNKDWTGKWISIGGSYPGALSAYYRLKFPYLVAGAIASSAPVMAKENFIEYDGHVTLVAGTDCAHLMRDVVTEVETHLNDPEALAKIKAQFDASDVINNTDFLYLIADVGASAIQYGEKNVFCASLSEAPTPLEGYATYAKKLYKDFGITAVDITAQGALSENINDYHQNIGLRQWFWQSCLEFGFWQNANPNPALSTRSSRINLDYHHNICKRLFGTEIETRIDDINSTYYLPLMDELVSRIYFTNGEQDPWSTLSLAEKNGNAVNGHLSYQLITDAAHCDDLRAPKVSDSEAIKEARERALSLIGAWL